MRGGDGLARHRVGQRLIRRKPQGCRSGARTTHVQSGALQVIQAQAAPHDERRGLTGEQRQQRLLALRIARHADDEQVHAGQALREFTQAIEVQLVLGQQRQAGVAQRGAQRFEIARVLRREDAAPTALVCVAGAIHRAGRAGIVGEPDQAVVQRVRQRGARGQASRDARAREAAGGGAPPRFRVLKKITVKPAMITPKPAQR